MSCGVVARKGYSGDVRCRGGDRRDKYFFQRSKAEILNNYAAPVKAESRRTGSCIYCRL
jgi:hypothetical protein